MKNFLPTASLALMLLTSMQFAHGNDNGERGDRSDQQRRDRSEQRQQERSNAADRRAAFDSRRPEVDRVNQTEQTRRANHLSAEERRALRQQINEAAQDIYNRRR